MTGFNGILVTFSVLVVRIEIKMATVARSFSLLSLYLILLVRFGFKVWSNQCLPIVCQCYILFHCVIIVMNCIMEQSIVLVSMSHGINLCAGL